MITQSELKQQLTYNPETGEFTYNFSTPRDMSRAGRVAGAYDKDGYVRININDYPYGAHRLAFLYMTGSVPVEVDHKDRVTSNNKWLNLREATRSLNAINRKLPNNNTSGHKGVSWQKINCKWLAVITVNKKHKSLGSFVNKADAIAARKAAEVRYHAASK